MTGADFFPIIGLGSILEPFATKLCNFYIQLYGFPHMIISDQESKFIGKFWISLMATLKVKLGIALAYHLQTNRQINKVNYIIGTYLRIFAYYILDK
jgi:hypothetical protein